MVSPRGTALVPSPTQTPGTRRSNSCQKGTDKGQRSNSWGRNGWIPKGRKAASTVPPTSPVHSVKGGRLLEGHGKTSVFNNERQGRHYIPGKCLP